MDCGHTARPRRGLDFYLHLDDNLLRIFGVAGAHKYWELGTPGMNLLEAKMASRSIDQLQRKVRERNFDIVSNIRNLNNVPISEKSVLYGQRNEV